MRRRWRRWALIWGTALFLMWAVFDMVGSPGKPRGGEPAAAVAANGVAAPMAADAAIIAHSATGRASAADKVPVEEKVATSVTAEKDLDAAAETIPAAKAAPSMEMAAAAVRTTAMKTTPASARSSAVPDSAAPLTPSVSARDGSRPTVYLTFDDGPSEHTAHVLDLLRDEGIAATFFVLGQQAERYPDLMRRIVAEGHVVGNHSYNHRYEELYGDFRSFAKQLRRAEEAIERTAGVRTRLVRAPGGTFGNFDQTYFRALEEAGYLLYDWNVDSGDAKRKNVPAAEIVRNVTKAPLRDVMIVLLHDGAGHAETVKALPAIIAHFKRHGYAFGVLSEQVEPVVFREAPRLKWKRNAVPLDAALSWLGGEKAAAVRAASAAQVHIGDVDNPAVPALGTTAFRKAPAAEMAISLGRGATDLADGYARLSGRPATEPEKAAGRLLGWPSAGPMNVAGRLIGWPLTAPDPAAVLDGTWKIRSSAAYWDVSVVMAKYWDAPTAMARYWNASTVMAQYRGGSMAAATAGSRGITDVSFREAEHGKTAARDLAPQELFRVVTGDYVPVRLWGERSGGVVRWNQRPAKATVTWSGAVLEITPDDGLLGIVTNKERRLWKADVRVIDGKLYVDADTLRQVVSFLRESGR